jgi:nitric oxide reductase activation protein
VQDAAEASAALYDMAIAIPNVPAHRVPGDWGGLDEDAVACALDAPDAGPDLLAELPEGEELVYESPGGSGYRGDLKPELVQLLEEMSELERSGDVDAQLTREQLEALLASSAEIELGEDPDAVAGERDGLLSRLELEAAGRAHGERERLADDANGGETPEIQWFRYDEWDFRAGDYRPDWCRVGERVGTEGGLAFYDETLRRHHGLVVETRRQFERMRPESFRRLRRLEDGHEIDLDHAIEFRADKRAGAGPQARFYARRNKVRRDVAVVFLLDMSGSTGERIPRPSRDERRIIDLERESAVLVVEALEAIGDAYGIYGFSGDGRENVEIHVVKDLDEPLDDRVRRRIDGIEPVRATRMGAALRHAARKLLDHEARVKILILVSDGRPEDEGYGRERGENEYAVHDTRRALLEARRQRITPFLITVDTAGQDYLRHMCDDLGYELVADVESLPRRLPKLYRHLAAE